MCCPFNTTARSPSHRLHFPSPFASRWDHVTRRSKGESAFPFSFSHLWTWTLRILNLRPEKSPNMGVLRALAHVTEGHPLTTNTCVVPLWKSLKLGTCFVVAADIHSPNTRCMCREYLNKCSVPGFSGRLNLGNTEFDRLRASQHSPQAA